MRHLSMLIAAMVVAPLSWLLLAIGPDRPADSVLAGTTLLLGALLLVAVLGAGRWRRRPSAAEPEPERPRTGPGPAQAVPGPAQARPGPAQARPQPAQAVPGPAQAGPLDVAQAGRGGPAPVPVLEPEPVNRHSGTPRSGNRGPNSSRSVNNSADRWVANGRSARPYARRSPGRNLDG